MSIAEIWLQTASLSKRYLLAYSWQADIDRAAKLEWLKREIVCIDVASPSNAFDSPPEAVSCLLLLVSLIENEFCKHLEEKRRPALGAVQILFVSVYNRKKQ